MEEKQGHLLWNWSQVNATESDEWEVNIGSGNGLGPWGNKPLPELMQTLPERTRGRPWGRLRVRIRSIEKT